MTLIFSFRPAALPAAAGDAFRTSFVPQVTLKSDLWREFRVIPASTKVSLSFCHISPESGE